MPTFDVEKALDQIDGDQEALSMLLSTFRRVSPKQIEDLHEAIQERDAERLAAVAHCLKGSLGVFAAEPAAETARQLEIHAREADFNRAQRAVTDLEAECAQLIADLATFLNSTE